MSEQQNAKQTPAYNGTLKAIDDFTNKKGEVNKVGLLSIGEKGTIPFFLRGKTLTAFVNQGFKVGDKIRVMGHFDIARQDGTTYNIHHRMKTEEYGEVKVLAMSAVWTGPVREREAAAEGAGEAAQVPASTQAAPQAALEDDMPF